MVAEQQLQLAQLTQIPVGLLFIDLDGLKHINDNLGHELGDAALVTSANLIKQTFRNSDTLGRIGGDEFVVLMQGINPTPETLVQRLQAQIDDFNQHQHQSFQISMSIGIQYYDRTQSLSLGELITQADRQMYQQKRLKKANQSASKT